jgi:hypothetical protein
MYTLFGSLQEVISSITCWLNMGFVCFNVLVGAISILNYAASYNHVPLIPYIISLSTRFDMSDAKRRHGKQVMKLLEDQVSVRWNDLPCCMVLIVLDF